MIVVKNQHKLGLTVIKFREHKRVCVCVYVSHANEDGKLILNINHNRV